MLGIFGLFKMCLQCLFSKKNNLTYLKKNMSIGTMQFVPFLCNKYLKIILTDKFHSVKSANVERKLYLDNAKYPFSLSNTENFWTLKIIFAEYF